MEMALLSLVLIKTMFSLIRENFCTIFGNQQNPSCLPDLAGKMLLFALILLSLIGFLCAETINTDVSQVFDASTSVVRYSAEIKASQVSGEYQLIFPNSWAENLAFISVTSKGKQLDVKAPVRFTFLVLTFCVCYSQ